MSRFGELLRYYRERCADPDRLKGKLTQARLGEFLGAVLGLQSGYTAAAVSEWERGKSRIAADNRLVLTALIEVLKRRGGLRSLNEADTFLLAGKYSPLDDDERRRIFPEGLPDKPEAPSRGDLEDQWRLIVMFLGELIFRPSEELRAVVTSASEGPLPAWPRILLALLGWPMKNWSGAGVLGALAWVVVWLLTWAVTFPVLRWPFADRQQALIAVAWYVAGAFILPLFVGTLTRTKDDEFWNRLKLDHRLLRLFTHIGAMLGFHLAYMSIFALALFGHYLGLSRTPRWLDGVGAIWPVLLAYASARQLPFNYWRAFGKLEFTESDLAMLLAYGLFGPVWGALFFATYDWLLSPVAGGILILSAVAALAATTLWHSRRGEKIIPAYMWAFVVGMLVTLQTATTGNVFAVTASAGIALTTTLLLAWKRISVTLWGAIGLLVACSLVWACLQVNTWFGRFVALATALAWWRLGKQFIWFPLGFWGVIVAATAAGWLVRKGVASVAQAAVLFALSTGAVLWLEHRRTNPIEPA